MVTSGTRWRVLVQLSAVPQPVWKAASVLPVFSKAPLHRLTIISSRASSQDSRSPLGSGWRDRQWGSF